ncbi:family 43 glycosylhydrolase [Mucilaginibacter pallidiroseus]|uniref:Family 43 glycosylhydrolase n=1 Tax=Mucilaginibacter pallidiroseus TaxID=2599295 RepID=A0A563UJM2_9SPHI|nr:glycoside hydrolase family 43 protein [Mucilaginibacter pallidiroseus]TWR31488.1 family 43 glycosylhydrolase [Mucilaginibacter pallidiroseus]
MNLIKFFLLLFVLSLASMPAMLFAQGKAVIPGDFADPSIIKVKDTYYAVGTSSEWAPHFPVYVSSDLKNWQQAGYVFDKAPAWTSGSFWAPEYYKINDTYYIYYTARRKSDNTSYIGVATSNYPDKGFKDHGVIIEFGKEAIDAFVFNDGGQLYITFKAYGLDNRPIELLGSKLSADGLSLEGETFSLLKDDQRIGMEGQSIIKHDDYYYLFYSAGDCCGIKCGYNVRVARAKSFTGPYEIYANNPILAENNDWKCMGHGTFVQTGDGKLAYLHHAYNKNSNVLAGRQGLLSALTWPQENGWPVFKAQTEMLGNAERSLVDNFNGNAIAKYWQWDFRNASPVVKQGAGLLHLSGTVKPGNKAGIVLTVRPVSNNFEASTIINNYNEALKGLAFYGDANAALGVGISGNKIIAWQVKGNTFDTLAFKPVNKSVPVKLKLSVVDGKKCLLLFKQGKTDWTPLQTVADISFLPQWDRSPRVGLHFKGDEKLDAAFTNFTMVSK